MCCILIVYISELHNTNTIQAKTGGLCCSGTNAFINFFTSVHRHKERDTILTMLTPPQRAVHLVMVKSLLVEIRKTQLHASTVENSNLCPNGRDLNYLPPCFNVNSQVTVFQNLQILRTISSGHDVIHTSSFPVWGVYYDNGDCHILCTGA